MSVETNVQPRSKATVIGMTALLVALTISALAVIYCKNRSRSMFIDIENHERMLDQYEVEWGQMQIELTTLAEQNRVEQIAKKRLKLVMPAREKIIYVKP